MLTKKIEKIIRDLKIALVKQIEKEGVSPFCKRAGITTPTVYKFLKQKDHNLKLNTIFKIAENLKKR